MLKWTLFWAFEKKITPSELTSVASRTYDSCFGWPDTAKAWQHESSASVVVGVVVTGVVDSGVVASGVVDASGAFVGDAVVSIAWSGTHWIWTSAPTHFPPE